jgi:hypothetical protein
MEAESTPSQAQITLRGIFPLRVSFLSRSDVCGGKADGPDRRHMLTSSPGLSRRTPSLPVRSKDIEVAGDDAGRGVKPLQPDRNPR